MSTDNINATDANKSIEEMVFENRNKAYGAYDLRNSYRSILTKSFIIGSIAFVVLAVAPLLYMGIKAMQGEETTEVSVQLDEILDTPPPVLEEEEPPPPPPEIEEPEVQQEVVKDMIPEPKPNPPVEEPPKKMEEVKETTTGVKNVEGEKIKTYTPPPPPPVSGAGKNVEAPKPIPDNEIVEHVDQDAVFEKGGLAGFRKLFQQNFDSGAIDADGTLKAVVTFVVEKNGSISQVQATGSNRDFNKEAERAVKSISGKWRPGKKDNQEVRSRFRMPVTMNFEF